MSVQCPHNISRGIYAFFEVATHTCSHRNCKKPERRRVVVDGKERVEENPRECRFGYPRSLLGFMTGNSDCICVRGHLENISLARCLAEIVRTYTSPGIYVRTISFFGVFTPEK